MWGEKPQKCLKNRPQVDARGHHDRLPPQGQEQDQAQEALEPDHVHVLLLRLRDRRQLEPHRGAEAAEGHEHLPPGRQFN